MSKGNKWSHWNVRLWLANTESTYREINRILRVSKTKDIAARKILTDLGLEGNTTPDGAKYTLTSVRAALVDW